MWTSKLDTSQKKHQSKYHFHTCKKQTISHIKQIHNSKIAPYHTPDNEGNRMGPTDKTVRIIQEYLYLDGLAFIECCLIRRIKPYSRKIICLAKCRNKQYRDSQYYKNWKESHGVTTPPPRKACRIFSFKPSFKQKN